MATTEIVVKSRGNHGPAAVELFDTRTGILKDKIMAFADSGREAPVGAGIWGVVHACRGEVPTEQ